VLSLEVLILELLSIDGFSTGAILGSEITTLCHKVSDNSVEGATLVVKRLAHLTGTLLTSAESTEVLGCQRSVSEELELNSAC